jgi:hypothetical protein
VEPSDPGVIYAVELERVDTAEYIEGIDGFFHDETCFARVRNWRREEKPS